MSPVILFKRAIMIVAHNVRTMLARLPLQWMPILSKRTMIYGFTVGRSKR